MRHRKWRWRLEIRRVINVTFHMLGGYFVVFGEASRLVLWFPFGLFFALMHHES
jgi:hypothetical protein